MGQLGDGAPEYAKIAADLGITESTCADASSTQQAIREEGLGGKYTIVVNELTPISRAALADEIVTLAIATPLANFCRELVALMVAVARDGPAAAPGQTFLPLEIYVPENI